MACVSAENVLYIMRGCPGSGKSTLATELKGRNGRIFSTDDLFVQADGEYVFDPKKVAGYHKRNQERAREAISEGASPVVIDNTNTTFWEMRPYVEAGLRHGYRIEFVEPTTPWRYDIKELCRRNTHGVKEEVIKRMLKRFQKTPTVAKVLGKRVNKRVSKSQSSELGEASEYGFMPNKLIDTGDDIATAEECNRIHLVPNPHRHYSATNEMSPFGFPSPHGVKMGTGEVGTGDIFTIPFIDLLSLINDSFLPTKYNSNP